VSMKTEVDALPVVHQQCQCSDDIVAVDGH